MKPSRGQIAAYVLMGALIWLLVPTSAIAASNVILMIGDGMSYQHVNAGSYYVYGAAGMLSFEPYYRCGVTTYSANSSVTDSAAAASALATGHKVNNGVVSQAPNGSPYLTILEEAKAMGKRTGLVTMVPITHATPAAFGAHELSRNSYINIGNDYLNSSRPDVIFGAGDPARGGASYFSNSQVTAAQSLGYQVVYNYSQMDALNPASVNRALGLFAGGSLTYEYDRQPTNTEPHISQMTAKTLAIASQDPDGFFLMIEGGMIDYAAHARDIRRTTREVVEFNNSVQVVLDWMQTHPDTLLLVTGDHETGGLTATNLGAGVYPGATWGSGDHTGANVPLYAYGAGAGLVNNYIVGGVIDNTDVYRIMSQAFVIPEPSALLALFVGFAGAGVARARRR